MSDEKNDIDTDFEEKLAEIVNKKSRNRTNNNIYERFINRVQNGEDDCGDNDDAENVKQWDDTKKLSPYEPLSESELELFSSQNSDREENSDTIEATFDFSDQETSLEIEPSYTSPLFKNRRLDDLDNLDNDALNLDFDDDDVNNANQTPEPTSIVRSDTDKATDELDHNDNDRLGAQDQSIQPAVKDVASSQATLASSKKQLIIGMLCGSLLIVSIVMALIFTGVLAPSVQTTVPDSKATISGSNVDTEATPETTPAVNTAQVPANAIEQPVIETQPALTGDNQEVGTPTKVEATDISPTDATAKSANTLDTDPAITYEDFREESQNTLYRETND